MAFDEETLNRLYHNTDGRCHLCHGRVAFANYGLHGHRGAWEVDHSVPRANGGTNRINNLKPAHIVCNRSKQAKSTRAIRARHGKGRAPLSTEARERKREESALISSLVFGGVGYLLGPGWMVIGGIAGLIMGHNQRVES